MRRIDHSSYVAMTTRKAITAHGVHCRAMCTGMREMAAGIIATVARTISLLWAAGFLLSANADPARTAKLQTSHRGTREKLSAAPPKLADRWSSLAAPITATGPIAAASTN